MVIVIGIIATSLSLAYGGDIADNPYLGAEVAFLVIFVIAFVAFLFQVFEAYTRPFRSAINGTIGAAGAITNAGINAATGTLGAGMSALDRVAGS